MAIDFLTYPAHASVPPGHLSVIVTYLEMVACPKVKPLSEPRRDISLVRANPPTASFYRYLYDTVGEPWLWHERRRLPRRELERVIEDPRVEVWVLYVSGTPAGYFEIDRRALDTDLAYFGLTPDFIGLRLGPWLLDRAIRRAWEGGAKRLLVNTCSFDHPKALELYQAQGFHPIRHVVRQILDPRIQGWLPREAGPHIPIVG